MLLFSTARLHVLRDEFYNLAQVIFQRQIRQGRQEAVLKAG